MKFGVLAAVLGFGLAGFLPGLARAAVAADPAGQLDPSAAIAESERAVGRVLGGYQLIDATGARLSLRDYAGKPLIISLIYTACSSVCPPTTQHLIEAVNEATRVFGADAFNVLTLGFDARNDTPARLTQFSLSQGIRAKNWRLASADPATIKLVLRDLGFSYRAIAGGFDHVTQTTIIDRDGKVYRHVYGDDFPLPMFMEPLKDAVYGSNASMSFAGLLDRVKFICTTYDSRAARYRFDYGLVFGGVIAGLSLLVFGGVIYREWYRGRTA